MKEVLLLKLGEIVLKGLNRRRFEDKLLSNLKRRLKKVGEFPVYVRQSVIYVEMDEDTDADAVVDAVKNVFGIVYICRAAVCEKNMDAIFQTTREYLTEEIDSVTRFKVSAKRSDKKFSLTSIQIAQQVGGDLDDLYPHLVPDMHHPELEIFIEIRDDYACIHAGDIPGPGGIPVGTSGKAALLLSGGIDSPVAGYMMAKRGLEICGVHFFSYPYTSEQAKRKVITLAEKLTDYTGRVELYIVPFTKIQERIRDTCPEDLFTLIMRRFMMRISERLAKQNGCGALITGESLGQVASQTMNAMAVTGEVCTIPVFRPVIGMDKEEIIRIARRIDTFETSILPYEDCCTVFTPKHPNLRPKLYKVQRAETALEDLEMLILEACENTEKVIL